MHSHGYAHRDIKPENVLIEKKNNTILVKLVDFGLAKHLHLDRNTDYIATRWYRAPELLLSMPYNTSIDIFALGCLMA
jgi:serine/threonine protein kinase